MNIPSDQNHINLLRNYFDNKLEVSENLNALNSAEKVNNLMEKLDEMFKEFNKENSKTFSGSTLL